MQESQQVNVSSRDSDRLRHPNSQLLDEPWSTWKFPQSGAEETHLFAFKLQNLQESRHLEAQYEAAEQEAAEAQVEALTAQKAARQARLLGDQHVCYLWKHCVNWQLLSAGQAQDQRTQAMKKAESEREAKIHSDLEEKPVLRLLPAVAVIGVFDHMHHVLDATTRIVMAVQKQEESFAEQLARLSRADACLQ